MIQYGVRRRPCHQRLSLLPVFIKRSFGGVDQLSRRRNWILIGCASCGDTLRVVTPTKDELYWRAAAAQPLCFPSLLSRSVVRFTVLPYTTTSLPSKEIVLDDFKWPVVKDKRMMILHNRSN